MNEKIKSSVSSLNRAYSRRDFIKTSTAAGILAAAHAIPAYAAGSDDTLKIGIVGCGDRGTGALRNAFDCAEGSRVRLVAMADVFQDKIDRCLGGVRNSHPGNVAVPDEQIFVGFDACKRLLETDIDIVFLTTPTHFRPMELRAAIEAGKHVFAEKPFGVDPVNTRTIFETADLADEKGLSIVVGTQQRYQPHYQEIIEHIRDGRIGDVVGAQVYWLWGFQDWHLNPRRPEWSDMEWQLRNWPYFVWLSGDHVVEQHFHNVDVMNWAMGGPPTQAIGMGGRQARTEEKYGNIWDHFAVEFEYPGGVRTLGMASQINGTTSRVGERIVGTKGTTWTTRDEGRIQGENPWQYERRVVSGMEEEHAKLIRSILDGEPINEARRAAETNMTVLMARMSAYTGRAISYNWVRNASRLDMSLDRYELGDMPVHPVAIPGQVEMI